MDTPSLPRPPYDPELEAALAVTAGTLPQSITAEMIPMMRQAGAAQPSPVLADDGIETRDVTIAGSRGDDIVVTVYTRPGRTGFGPEILHIHGGGMIGGDRHLGVDLFGWLLSEANAVVISVEYRLAPEYPDPYPVEDCYAALVWVAANAEQLGLELDRLIVGGGSAGGGLSAGVALLARDRGGPSLRAQLLICPMLDDRDVTVSTRQYEDTGIWTRGSNLAGWTALLGDRRGTDDVSIYAAPARASDLSGLPSTYIDCGSAEVFRDEDVAYATRIWEAGGQAELHVWAGGFHAFDGLAPHAAVSQASISTRNDWLRRVLSI